MADAPPVDAQRGEASVAVAPWRSSSSRARSGAPGGCCGRASSIVCSARRSVRCVPACFDLIWEKVRSRTLVFLFLAQFIDSLYLEIVVSLPTCAGLLASSNNATAGGGNSTSGVGGTSGAFLSPLEWGGLGGDGGGWPSSSSSLLLSGSASLSSPSTADIASLSPSSVFVSWLELLLPIRIGVSGAVQALRWALLLLGLVANSKYHSALWLFPASLVGVTFVGVLLGVEVTACAQIAGSVISLQATPNDLSSPATVLTAVARSLLSAYLSSIVLERVVIAAVSIASVTGLLALTYRYFAPTAGRCCHGIWCRCDWSLAGRLIWLSCRICWRYAACDWPLELPDAGGDVRGRAGDERGAESAASATTPLAEGGDESDYYLEYIDGISSDANVARAAVTGGGTFPSFLAPSAVQTESAAAAAAAATTVDTTTVRSPLAIAREASLARLERAELAESSIPRGAEVGKPPFFNGDPTPAAPTSGIISSDHGRREDGGEERSCCCGLSSTPDCFGIRGSHRYWCCCCARLRTMGEKVAAAARVIPLRISISAGVSVLSLWVVFSVLLFLLAALSSWTSLLVLDVPTFLSALFSSVEAASQYKATITTAVTYTAAFFDGTIKSMIASLIVSVLCTTFQVYRSVRIYARAHEEMLAIAALELRERKSKADAAASAARAADDEHAAAAALSAYRSAVNPSSSDAATCCSPTGGCACAARSCASCASVCKVLLHSVAFLGVWERPYGLRTVDADELVAPAAAATGAEAKDDTKSPLPAPPAPRQGGETAENVPWRLPARKEVIDLSAFSFYTVMSLIPFYVSNVFLAFVLFFLIFFVPIFVLAFEPLRVTLISAATSVVVVVSILGWILRNFILNYLLANKHSIQHPRWFLFFDVSYSLTVGIAQAAVAAVVRAVTGALWSAARCAQITEVLLPGPLALLDAGWMMHGAALKSHYVPGAGPLWKR